MSIESKNFVASTSDVERIAAEIIDGMEQTANGRGTYLRMVVGTVQHDLGATPRLRASSASRLPPEEIPAQLKALNAVHKRFYEAVYKVAQNSLPTPDKVEVKRRCTFARTAASTLRGWIRTGNDVCSLAAGRVTKYQLAVEHAKRPLTARALGNRAVALMKNLRVVARKLVSSDAAKAREFLTDAMDLLTGEMKKVGIAPTAAIAPARKHSNGAARRHAVSRMPAAVPGENPRLQRSH
jgi:hypothetical protein